VQNAHLECFLGNKAKVHFLKDHLEVEQESAFNYKGYFYTGEEFLLPVRNTVPPILQDLSSPQVVEDTVDSDIEILE